MFRLKAARVCALLSTLCAIVTVAVALGDGPTGALLGFGLGGAAIGFAGWRFARLVA